MPEVCLVVPCFNEEHRLRSADLLAAVNRGTSTSLCLVNDGSTDGTRTALERLQAQRPDRILVLPLERNVGKAEAVRRGVLHATRSGRFRLVGYWDADLSTPLAEVDRLIAALERHSGPQLAMGSRVKRLGSRIERRVTRHILGRLFATCASAVLGLPVYDSQCGAKLFRVEVVDVLFKEPFLTRWLFDVEIIARLRNHLGTLSTESAIEVPLRSWAEVGGSKLRLRHMIGAPLDLLRIRAHYNKKA